MIVSEYFLWFMIYSFIGWVFESIFCSVQERRLINRGFLNGPFCPIYGTGAVLCILLLGRIQHPVLLFALGMVITTTIEYITGWLLETLFHTRWWDYSKEFLNLHGRICLGASIGFGAMILILIKVIHPAVLNWLMIWPDSLKVGLSLFLAMGIGADTAFTASQFYDFNEKLKALDKSITERMTQISKNIDKTFTQIADTPGYKQVAESIAEFRERLNKQQKRMINAFPDLDSTRYSEIMKLVMDKNPLKRGAGRSRRKRAKDDQSPPAGMG